MLRRHFLATAATTAAVTAVTAPAVVRAQAWPSRPITLVVPFPAGGGTDAFAAFLKRDIARWATVVKDDGVKLE